MTSILAFFHLDDPASLKRALAVALTALATLLRPILSAKGIPVPDDEQMTALAGLVAMYVLQSGAKSIVQAHADGKVAAAKVDTVEKADAVIAAALKPSSDEAVTPAGGSVTP
jgi:hypothetical protein